MFQLSVQNIVPSNMNSGRSSTVGSSPPNSEGSFHEHSWPLDLFCLPFVSYIDIKHLANFTKPGPLPPNCTVVMRKPPKLSFPRLVLLPPFQSNGLLCVGAICKPQSPTLGHQFWQLLLTCMFY